MIWKEYEHYIFPMQYQLYTILEISTTSPHVQTHLPALFWAAALHGLQDMVDLLRQTLSVVHLFAKLVGTGSR